MAIHVFFFLFATIMALGLASGVTASTKYCIVVDAHPTSTRTYLYSWDGASLIGNTGIVMQENSGCRTRPGIGIYTSKPMDGVPALRNCLNEVEALVPEDKRNHTRIYFQAAGMRLLSILNNTLATDILKAVRALLASYPFQFQGGFADILTGAKEGVDGWIHLNYLKGIIAPDSPGGTTTFGALGLGHGSAQITFIPKSGTIKSGFAYPLSLYGKQYTLYSQSFPCYGLTEARRRIQAAIVKAGSYADVVNSPCHFQGDSINVTGDYLFQGPCSSSPTDQTLTSKTFMLVGTSNGPACDALVKTLFTDPKCPFHICSFSTANTPALTGSFVAYRGYAYQADYINASTGPAEVGALRSSSLNLCKMNWDLVKNLPGFNIEYAHLYCFDALYRSGLLKYGFQFPDGYTVNLQLGVNSTTLSWAYGFMVNTTTMIPSDTPTVGPTTSNSVATFIVSSVLLLFVILTSVSV